MEEPSEKTLRAVGNYDVRDTINAVEHLVKHDLANAGQVAIRGGSAGGYLVLACLADSDLFSAGVSYYGIADLELLTKDTHKFESRYLERLIGPYPDKIELYKNRSPINKLQNISAPVLILQGKLDKIVRRTRRICLRQTSQKKFRNTNFML